MRAACFTFAMLALSACQMGRPALSDAQMQRLQQAMPGMTAACREKIRWGGVAALPSETDQCHDMMPAQRWKGLWVKGFETSEFCADRTDDCPLRARQSVWLTLRPDAGIADPDDGFYEIEFIGRRTKQAGSYGGVGISNHEVIVDRILSLRLIP